MGVYTNLYRQGRIVSIFRMLLLNQSMCLAANLRCTCRSVAYFTRIKGWMAQRIHQIAEISERQL